MIKAVVFDMDGLMFDTEALSFKGWKISAKNLGYVFTDDDLLAVTGRTNAGIKEYFKSIHGEALDFEALLHGAETYMSQEVKKSGPPLKKGLRELLSHIRKKGLKSALATSSHEDIVELYFGLANLGHDFDAVVCGNMVKNGKPHPEIFAAAASKIGIAPEHCLALEDSHNGIRSAHAAGMNVVMIPDLLPPTPEIEKLLFRRVDSLFDVIELC